MLFDVKRIKTVSSKLYHYVHNTPINLVDTTGMSAQNPGEGDPVKQPQKILHIKVRGVDRSLYYEGDPWVFGTGGFKFNSGSATRSSSVKIPEQEHLSEKITVQRIDYRATKPFGNNGSTLHRPVGRDTTVVRGNEGIVKKLDTRDSLRESIKVKKYNGL